jgi:hypothetical protein
MGDSGKREELMSDVYLAMGNIYELPVFAKNLRSAWYVERG